MTGELLYQGCAVAMQEVPDEIALTFSIAGCPYRCEGCHSPELWENKGENLWDHYLSELDSHPGVTCVCFMGGDTQQPTLAALCDLAHERGLKTCLYSGTDDIGAIMPVLYKRLDYLKIGGYNADLGPLSSPTTNQRMYRLSHGSAEDITWRFQKFEL